MCPFDCKEPLLIRHPVRVIDTVHHLQGDLQFRRLHNGEDLIGYSLVEGNGRDGGTGGLAAVFPAADAFVQGAYAAIPGITDSHAAATLAADQESREEGGAFARRSAELCVCLVGAELFLVRFEIVPGDIGLVMPGNEYPPFFLVRETDGMVFEMAVSIYGFIVPVTAIHICASIGRVMSVSYTHLTLPTT